MRIKTIVVFSVLLVSILFVASSCSEIESIEIVRGYEMGFSTDNKVRTYSYFRLPENDTITVQFDSSFDGGIHYVTEYSNTNGGRLGERKFRIDGNKKIIVDQTMYYTSDHPENRVTLVHAEIIRHKAIDKGKYSGGNYSSRFSIPGNIIQEVSVRETFEKDTTYSWNGRPVPAIKFSDETTYHTYYRFIPFIGNSKISGSGYVLFANDVGLVYYTMHAPPYNFEMTLVKVEVTDGIVDVPVTVNK